MTRCIDRQSMAEDGGCRAARPSPECEVSDRRLGGGNAHVVVRALDSSSCLPKIDNRLVTNSVSGMQRQNNLGPESLEGHAAVRLGNKGRGKGLRQNNDSARSDALAGGVVGNGRNVVDTSVTAELLAGAQASSLADRHHFDLNLSDLLDKSAQCKRNWLVNAIAARQKFERQQANFEGIQTLSIANSKLIKWMTAGRASWCSPSTLFSPTPHPLGTTQSPICRDQRQRIFS